MDELDDLTPAEQKARFMEIMDQLAPEDYPAFAQLMEWMAQRPKDAESLTPEKMEELLEDIRRENTRRRLGGKVGVILPFNRAKQDS
jgi:hypothetical protein